MVAPSLMHTPATGVGPEGAVPPPSPSSSAATAGPTAAASAAVAAGLRGSFVENIGQLTDPSILLYAAGDGISAGFCRGKVVDHVSGESGASSDLVVRFEGCTMLSPEGRSPLAGRSSFLLGADEARWRAGARAFAEVLFRGLYPGVDVAYRLEGGTLKYEARLAPGIDPTVIRLAYEGALSLGIDEATGDLLVGTEAGELREGAPRSYQADGAVEVPVESRFVVSGGSEVGFALVPHRADLPLVIDPGLPFSTYLGGTGDDWCGGLEVDAEGNSYVTGFTMCSDFPSGPAGYDLTLNGQMDAFIAKLNPQGTALLWSTFIGGSDSENGWDIDLDRDGNVYVVGETRSKDFPTTPGAWDRELVENDDAFAVKLDPTGSSLLYSTYFGSRSWNERALEVAVDGSGNAYIAGWASSSDFPTTPGAYDTTFNGRQGTFDAFLLKLNSTASGPIYSTFLGGYEDDFVRDLLVDGSGYAYVAGYTRADPFPTTEGAYQRSSSGGEDMFVAKFLPDGTDVVYSTLIGTPMSDSAEGLAFGPGGSLWIVGFSGGDTFPTTVDALDRSLAGMADAVLLRLSSMASSILYSTFIGGTENDYAFDLAFDDAGDFCLVGTTQSPDFPLSELPFNGTLQQGSGDCFFMRLDAALTGIVYSTLFGGGWADEPRDVQRAPGGFVIAAGYTEGGDFPVSPGAYDTWGSSEGFITKLDVVDPVLVTTDHDPFATTGDTFNISMGASDNHAVEEVSVEWWSGASPDHVWEPSSLISGTLADGNWNASLQAPAHSLEPIHFRVRVKDLMGNFIVGPELSVPVYDNDPPTFTDASRGPATTGDLLTLAVDVVDNIGVNETGASVRYWFGDAVSASTTASMRPASIVPVRNGTYDLVLRMPSNSTEPLYYAFLANDTSGNAGESEVLTLPVWDNDAPAIVHQDVPEPATTGDPFKVRVRFEDNIGMAMARVNYWFGPSGVQVTRTMSALDVDGRRNGIYEHSVEVPSDSLLDLYIMFTAADAVNNMCFGQVFTVKVVDNDAPSLARLPILPPPATGVIARLLVQVDDNIGVLDVGAWYAFDDLDEAHLTLAPLEVDARGVGQYVTYVNVPASASHFRFWFEANDTQGNANATEPLTLAVLDAIPPTISFHFNPDERTLRGMNRMFLVGVEDNIGVLTARMEFWFGEERQDNLTMVGLPDGTYTTAVHVPRAFDGTLRVLFSASDRAGNWNATMVFEWATTNAAPVISPLPTWQVVEGTEGRFDLAPYVSDANDPAGDLTVECDLERARVEGLSLRLNLSTWQPDSTLILRISDGEDTTTTRLALHVNNVNDAPVIGNVLPESGARFQEGREVRFLAIATDEDGDPLTFTWKEGDRVLGTGDALSVKGLHPGRHTVTLEVSDGNATTSQKLVIIMEEAEGGSAALLLILLIVALVVAALLLVLWRRRATTSRWQGPG